MLRIFRFILDPPLSATAVGIPATSLLFYPKPVILFKIPYFFTSLFLRLLYLKGGTKSRGTSLTDDYRTVFGRFLPKSGTFREKRVAPGRKINKCMSDGYPPARFSGHGTLYRVAANCSDPRIASGHHGVGQCDPQPLLWYNVPASYTPHTAGGLEGTLCLPSASGCRSRALRPAV